MTLYEGLTLYFNDIAEKAETETRYMIDNREYYFQKLIVENIDDQELSSFSSEILLRGIRKMQKRFGKETMIRVIRVLDYGFAYLKKEGVVPANYIRVYKREIDAIINESTHTAEERKRIVEQFPFMQNGNLFGFVTYSGIKPDRAVALNKESVFLVESVCYADRTLEGINSRGEPIFGIITRGNIRYPLTEKAKYYLAEEERKQAAFKRRLGERWHNPEGLWFTGDFGQPVSRESIKEDNKLLRKLTGIPDLTLERLSKMSLDFIAGADGWTARFTRP